MSVGGRDDKSEDRVLGNSLSGLLDADIMQLNQMPCAVPCTARASQILLIGAMSGIIWPTLDVRPHGCKFCTQGEIWEII